MKNEEIVKGLEEYVKRIGSQNKAAASMKGVSAATISQMINGNWDKIADEMWRKVAAAIGMSDVDWHAAETTAYIQINAYLDAVQRGSRVMTITAPAGSGKSFAAKCYAAEHKNVYVLMCDDCWSRNDFVNELLKSMGLKTPATNKLERLAIACEELKKKDKPLIVFDEFDKLNDNVWQFFITIYNRLEGKCGIVVFSTSYLEKRLYSGLKNNKKGYHEIWSRMGRKCVGVAGISYDDVKLVCEANGVFDEAVIEDIANDSEGDLRRVSQLVFGRMMVA